MAEAFGIYGRAGLKAGPSRVKFKTRVPMVKFDSHAHQHRQNVECLFCFSLMQISNKNRETISDRAVTPRSYRTRMFTFLMFSSEEKHRLRQHINECLVCLLRWGGPTSPSARGGKGTARRVRRIWERQAKPKRGIRLLFRRLHAGTGTEDAHEHPRWANAWGHNCGR